MHVPSNWYESFFYGVALDLWRQAVTPEQTRAEVDFLVKTFGGATGARLLDVPCGNGRHSLELAARGYKMTAVDLAEEFIEEARSSGEPVGSRVDWVHSDMRSLPWESEFDGAFCVGNSFAYLDYDGTRAFLAAVSRALKPGSKLIVEWGTAAESIISTFQARRWYEVADILMLIDNHYDVRESRLKTEYTFVRGGKVEKRKSSQEVYTVAEVRRMMREARLEVLELYGSPDEQPFQLGSPRLILVGRKQ